MSERVTQRTNTNASGIGRPITPGWVNTFDTLVNEALGNDGQFFIRKSPGVIYASGAELLGRGFEQGIEHDADKKHAIVANHVGALVASLCEDGKLDQPTSTKAVVLKAHKYTTKGRENTLTNVIERRVLNVRFKAEDVANPNLHGGFQTSGERTVIREFLGLSTDLRDQSSVVPPLLMVSMGLVEGYMSLEAVQKVQESMSDMVAFGGIGVVRTSTKITE